MGMNVALKPQTAEVEAPAQAWLPLTHAQRAVWLDVQLIGDPAAYQLGTVTDIEGELDPDLARQAVRLIMARHDALRLRIDAAEPRQRFETGGETPFHLTDLSLAADPTAAADAHLAATQAAGFRLGDEPLFRVDVLKLGAQRWRIAMLCHHLLGDGVSIALIQRHWAQAYATLCGETEDKDDDEMGMAPEPAPRSSYLPVIKDDEAYAASPRYAADLSYWRARLSPLPELVFADRPRPDSVTPGGDMPGLELDAPAFARFEAATRAAKTTTHRALLALLAVTLARRYGRQDLCLGMALHRRDLSTRHTIGMLAGMIAVRCRLDTSVHLAQAVEALGAEIDQDLRHARTPIDALGREMGLAALGRNSFFDAAVTIMPSSREAPPTLPGVIATSRSLRDPERTPLMLYVNEQPDRSGLSIRFGFDDAVLSQAEAMRLRDLYATALDALAARPATGLASLDPLTGDEYRLITEAGCGRSVAFPNATLPDLVERQVAATPEALAAVSDTGALTYAELNAAANRVAAALVAAGLKPGEPIGVAMARNLCSPVALLAVLKAGGVYLPLDPAYPTVRLHGMIEDAGARLVLTNTEAAHVLPQTATALNIQALIEDAAASTANPARPGLTPDDPAYLIYTSGSTGRPKGVCMGRRAAVNLAYGRLDHDLIGPGDRVLAGVSIGFDVSIGQLLLPLIHGATVVVAGQLSEMTGTDFWAFLRRHGVTHANSGPALIDAMLNESPGELALKRLMLGGEPFTPGLMHRLRKALPGVELINMYGPTETCIDATAYRLTGEETGATLPIGRPLPNYRAYILDSDLQPVGVGRMGELCIGGPSLAIGYLNQPEQTADKFRPDPFAAEGGRLYRTGDLAYWREDGLIAFGGRRDSQIKIRGFRIELGEIETALAAHPSVATAAVIAKPRGAGVQLFAYAIPSEPGATPPNFAVLKAYLAETLPDHMIPRALIWLDALPLTANGKLDVKALPEPEFARAVAVAAPRTATESLLAQLFAELLGAAEIDIADNFFELGGHSLLATQLAARLRAELGIELPIRALFEAPRIIDLAPRIDALRTGCAEAAPAGITVADRPDKLPLSFAQERLWFLFRLDQNSPAYNIPTVLRLDGALEISALTAALNGLVARHEALRTRFVEVDGEAVQVILPRLDVLIEVEDLEGREDQVAARALAEATRPFDLRGDPLVRGRLLRLGPTAHIILLTVHHIVSDGWSTGILVSEMSALYHAALVGIEAPLPPLPIQYADYAIWQRAFLAGEELARQTRFWQDALAGAPDAIALPHDHPCPAQQSFRGASLPLHIPKDLSDRTAALARAEQATPFIVLLSAWSALLARWSGEDDIVVGAPIANRTRAESEGLIGFFVNTLAFRADLSAEPSFRDLIAQMRTNALDAYAHQDLPFEKLVDALNPPRDLSRHPIFQVMFVLQNVTIGALDLPGLKLSPVPLQDTTAKFDLTLTLTETPDGLKGEISYATDLFAAETIARLSDQLIRLLDAATAAPAKSIKAIDLLSAEDRRRVLHDWSRSPVALAPQAETIPALFGAQAARTPDATAILFGEGETSYAALDQRANRIAHALIARGVGPDRPVGVALGRSDALIAAALGVMKAGGVYLPLDPAYPRERLATMLADSDAALTLTTAALADALPEGAATLLLEDLANETRPETAPTDADRLSPLTPDHLAYILYTSGSTGKPKGVAMPHGALAQLAAARLTHDPITVGDRVLASMSVSFDVSVGQLITPLLRGATVVVAPDLKTLSGAEFWDLVAKDRVTHINSGHAFIEAILDQAPPNLTLKRLMLGGEPFSLGLMQRLRQALPGVAVINMYGPTETCIDATSYTVTGDETTATLPIGRPLPGYLTYILDPRQRPVGPGQIGELYIGGPTLARGYLNRPDLTAERFIPNPFGAPGERLYRTGDLARWGQDGVIEFIGRIDTQVKIRGFRIELGEIEATLASHPDLASVAVVARPHQGRTRLVAYLVAARDASERPAIDALRRHLAQTLPDHMIPQAYVWLDALPVTRNAKLDLRALPEPEAADAVAADYAPPRNAREAALAEVWAEVLGLARVGIDDNFFDIGGHSLIALRLTALVEARLGVKTPVSAVFQHQTVRAFAEALQDDRTPQSSPLVRLQAGQGETPLFCIHPVGGGAMGYLPLARALGPALPVYGLQALDQPLAASIGDMAARYLAAIRDVQPHGPYRLLGHSFGGLVAFETTRQLEAAGEAVSLLALLDTSIPDAQGEAGPGGGAAEALLVAEAVGAGLSDGPQATANEDLAALVRHNIRLAAGYAPGQVQAPLTYIKALGDGREDGRDAFWRARSAHALPTVDHVGGHFQMLSADSAEGLAALIRHRL